MGEWLNKPVGFEGAMMAMLVFATLVFWAGMASAKAERKHRCSTCGHKDYRHTQIGCVLCRCGQFTQSAARKG